MDGTIHIAGEYEDGVQMCVRCFEILVDNRNAMIPAGSPPLRGFAQDEPITVSKGSPTSYIAGAQAGAKHCEPMV